jgi:hypothetical protein
MKYFYVLFFIFLNCSQDKVSIRLELEEREIYSCKEASVDKLSPKKGGFVFSCKEFPKKASVYVIYDTSSETANDGSIKEITLQNSGSSESFKPAVYSSKRGSIDCPRAKSLNRETGEKAFTETFFGYPQKGMYPLEMAQPCGTVKFYFE